MDALRRCCKRTTDVISTERPCNKRNAVMPPPFKNRDICTYVPSIDFRSLSFEKIGLLDSYFIYMYIIIQYRSSSKLGKFTYYCGSYDPYFNDILWLNMVSVHYLLEKISILN